MQELIDVHDENSDTPLLTMDGFDDCIVGIVEGFGVQDVLCYDREKVIAKNMADGMTREEAEEYLDHNQSGSVGDATPCFITLPDEPETTTDEGGKYPPEVYK